MSDQLPLVGRERELRTALRALAVDGAVLLSGPPGVGKTRLATEALAAVPHPVVRCYATVATSRIPLGAIASLVPTDLPASRGSILPSSSVRAAAEHLSRGGRRVLSVDDAHLLDDASLLVLQHLVRHRLTRIICTARPGWGMEGLTVVGVDALDQERAGALLATALGGPADASTRRLVWANSQGNPFVPQGTRRRGTPFRRADRDRGRVELERAAGAVRAARRARRPDAGTARGTAAAGVGTASPTANRSNPGCCRSAGSRGHGVRARR